LRRATSFIAIALLLVGCSKRQSAESDRKVDLPPGAHVVPSASVDPKVIAKLTGQPDAAPARLEQTLELIRLVYGDLHGKDTRSLHFRSERLSTDDMKQVLPLVDSYNGFVGTKVAAALEPLRGRIMYYEFGREGSPVIYVHLPYWTSQQEQSSVPREAARKFDAAEHAALVEKVRTVFKNVAADEIGEADSSDHVIRVWWD
jgi:hypothetical protein